MARGKSATPPLVPPLPSLPPSLLVALLYGQLLAHSSYLQHLWLYMHHLLGPSLTSLPPHLDVGFEGGRGAP